MHALKTMLLVIAAAIMLVAIAGAAISLKRSRRRPGIAPKRGILATIATAVLIVASLGGCTFISHTADGLNSHPDHSAAAETGVSVEVLRVVDGDTLAVRPTVELAATNQSGDEHTVRVLGIDTPEMNKASGKAPDCGAQEATDHLVALLDGHHEVTLFFDPVSDRTDRFGRSLAYVEIPGAQPVDVGLSQVSDGFAEAWYPKSAPEPQRYAAYASVQHDAEAKKAGSQGNCSTIGR